MKNLTEKNLKKSRMKEKVKSNNAITLIALVITIIVLLILAGVSIATLTGDNGVLLKVKEASEKNEQANEEELRRLTALEAATNVKNFEFNDSKGNKAVVPAGFAVSQVEGENEIDTGLVIIDSNGNEFVWIPVNLNENEKFDEVYPRTDFENNYPTGELDSMYTEPFENGFEGEKELFNSMNESVSKYKGFYIGRYEAGCEFERTEENKNIIQKVLIQKNKYVYNYTPWGNAMNDITANNNVIGAVELSRNFGIENNYPSVESTLIYGIQWDMVMRFVANEEHNINESSRWGNYGNTLIKTGTMEETKAKNIYDLAGNVYEWTLEAATSSRRVLRGGRYNTNNHPASDRTIFAANNFGGGIGDGFRVTLFIAL